MNKYRMNRFQPTGEYPERSEETRIISAESEEEAYALIGEPTDGSYWHITDSKPVETDAGETSILMNIPDYLVGGVIEYRGNILGMGEFADIVTVYYRVGNHRDTRQAFMICKPMRAAALAMLVYHRLHQHERMAWYAFVCHV